MSNYNYKLEYERHLPHIQPPGACLFVTIRLAGSIPTEVLERLKMEAEEREQTIRQTAVSTQQPHLLYNEQKRQFGRWDDVLDRAESGPHWLSQPEITTIVVNSLHFLDRDMYDMDAFSVMSNHAHLVFTPLEKEDGTYHALQKIMHSLKRHTAREGNKVLGREGAFWQHESYDHVVRNRQEWERIVAYVLNNPVKAGLVERWEDWPWSYLKNR
ncbi:MAG: transposase [Ardenticatenaceae bacterium]|nr:transposase [Ardenticatenaceae bacterium]